jgi:hypothetical protein
LVSAERFLPSEQPVRKSEELVAKAEGRAACRQCEERRQEN